MALPISEEILIGFGIVFGALVTGYIITVVSNLFMNAQNSQAFQNAIREITQSTIATNESIKDTAVAGVNAIVSISTLDDVNKLAKIKASEGTKA